MRAREAKDSKKLSAPIIAREKVAERGSNPFRHASVNYPPGGVFAPYLCLRREGLEVSFCGV